MATYPYAEQFEIQRGLREDGMDRADVLEVIGAMASAEDRRWETGQCSGTMYCGDHDHYAFLNEAFASFSHVNALQRDMCPSATKFEAEIIAMTLDLLGAGGLEAAGRARHLGGHRLDHPRGARLPRVEREADPASEPDQARDRAPRVRQGRPPLRRRDPRSRRSIR